MATSSLLGGAALAMVLALGGIGARAEAADPVPDRLLWQEAQRMAIDLTPAIWPGWEVPLETLIVGADNEYLVGSRRRPDGFEPIGIEGGEIAHVRERVFPRGMEATMALFGPPATIVIGTSEGTGREPTSWLLTLLHEHFHQWQMRDGAYFAAVEALELSGGDTSGMWMLEYPFPYGDPEVSSAYDELSRTLAGLVDGSGPAPAERVREFLDGYAGWLGSLDAADRRYVRFQLWQEGVARYVELALAREAAARRQPSPEVAVLDGFEDFAGAASRLEQRLFEELETADLAEHRRGAFYAFGAGLALLLDRTEPRWKERYEESRFRLYPSLP